MKKSLGNQIQDEFFIGWQGKAPERTGKFLRTGTGIAVGLLLVAGVLVAMGQRTIEKAWFDFGNVREFHGVLVKDPVPLLLTDTPDEESGESVFLLCDPFKHGFPADQAEFLHLSPVTVRGTLIHNERGGAMIEAVEATIRFDSGPPRGGAELPEPEEGTAVTLTGEIVDSKCWLGVMNPGTMKPHRACSINCIRGGIPPVLLVDRRDLYVMVGADGEPINDAILDDVALPVKVKGKLVDYGKIKVIKVNPAEIERL